MPLALSHKPPATAILDPAVHPQSPLILDAGSTVFAHEQPQAAMRSIWRARAGHVDARGNPTLVATRHAWHLSESRRSHYWNVLSRIGRDMHAAARLRARSARYALVGCAVLCYGVLLFAPFLPAALDAMLALLGLASVVGALLVHRVIDPTWRERRRIILAHNRCPCCLGEMSRNAAHTTQCATCQNAWLSDELSPLATPRAQACCTMCGYHTHACDGDCPECAPRLLRKAC